MRPVRITGMPGLRLEQQSSWPGFWAELQQVLKDSGYQRSSRMLYRSVLRGLARSARLPPCHLSADHIDAYIKLLARRRCSAHWLAMNISALRQMFDRCCGTSFLTFRTGPRRPFRLPGILSREELSSLMQSASCPRDALLLGLLYGCGLKPSQLLALHWGDFDPDRQILCLEHRELPLPKALLPLIKAGCTQADAGSGIFTGSRFDQTMDARSLSRIVQITALRAGLIRPVTAMTLRHSFAVHQLQAGVSIRELQEILGHQHVKTSMKYLMLVPPEHTSPADDLPEMDLCGHLNLPAEPPFGSTQPRHWFNGWFKDRLFSFLRAKPPPG